MKTPTHFCTPDDKNGEGVVDVETGVACFRIADFRGQPKFPGVDTGVEDQLGMQTLRVKRSKLLCVPTQRLK